MTKCIACDKDATVRFSPDLDIDGVFSCEEHKEEVHRDLFYALFSDKWKWFNKKYNNKNNKNAGNRKIE